MSVVESVSRQGETKDGRSIFRVTISGDKDWNGKWMGIRILGDSELCSGCPIMPGDRLWYDGTYAYWTPILQKKPKFPIVDIRFERWKFDFVAWRPGQKPLEEIQ